MKTEIRRATMSDVYAITQDLSEINTMEMRAKFGANWQWMANTLARKFLDAGPAETGLFDGEPVAVFGHMPHAEMSSARVTWFLAKELFMGAQGVIGARRYLKRLRAKHPDVTFISYTESKHPDAGRWFRLLGFEPMPAASETCLTFALVPKAVA